MDIDTRSATDPVAGGRVEHTELPYYRMFDTTVRSSMQHGRGGAFTSYFRMFRPRS